MSGFKNLELLAPGGSMESLIAAARYGADAVYIGGPLLQLRAGQTAFSMEDIKNAASHMHGLNKKLYVAANAFTYPNEIASIVDYAKQLKDAGVDAMIVSDMGSIRAIKRECPDMEVHVSTQANCTNHESATAYYEMGASRVVLARELSLPQIAELRAKSPKDLELEAFIHGAMCMAYSGRCLISSYLTGRSANRGGCAQSCRWTFALTEEKRPGQYFPVEEDEKGVTILSSYDLNAMELIDEIQKAGVMSLKIEGRMKTAYYVASVVNAYRMYLDGADLDICLKELECVSHRPYSTGFYKGEIITEKNAPASYLHDKEYAGPVLERQGDRILVEVKNKIVEGETIECVSPGKLGLSFTAQDMKNMDGENIVSAPMPGMLFTMPAPAGIEKGDYLRR